MESDLSNAVSEFEAARTLDPKVADATIGEASSIGYTLYMAGGDNERINALLPKVLGLMKQAKADAPDNPRFYWIDGPRLWTIGSSRGGGQDAAIACYERGLEMWRKEQTVRHG